MTELKMAGERQCRQKINTLKTEFFVITGGPGAGKTALLEFVRKTYCQHVAILPEAASILFGGGFWRLSSSTAKNAAQKAIYHIQSEMEHLVIEEKSWAIGLCDRGTLDGLAYWPGSEQSFFDSLHTNKQAELSKYKGIIHLSSPGESSGYNYQNPIRNESPQLAKQIDQKIHHIWSDHPNYFRIECTTEFLDKLRLGAEELSKMTSSILSRHY